MSKPKKRGSLAVSQIIILLVGIVAIAYAAGSQIGGVNAAPSIGATFTYGGQTYTVESSTHVYRADGENYYKSSTHCTVSQGWYWDPNKDGQFNQDEQNVLTGGGNICMDASFVTAFEGATLSQPSAPAPSTSSSTTPQTSKGEDLKQKIGGSLTNAATSAVVTSGVSATKAGLKKWLASHASPSQNLLDKIVGPTQPSATVAPSKIATFFKGLGVDLAEIAAYAGVAIATYKILTWLTDQIPGLSKSYAGEAWVHFAAAGASGVAGGYAAYQVGQWLGAGLGGTTLSLGFALGVGAALAVVIWGLLYHQHQQKAVVFTCVPWQAPLKSDNCGECGANGLPCTSYQCASLGQNCQLLNSGVNGKQICVATNKDDTVPPVMSFWGDELSQGYSYQPLSASVPSSKYQGVMISYKDSANGDIPPYTGVQFGITTNEPAKCGISPQEIPITNSSGTDTFNQLIPMDAGIFEYNHTFTFNTGNASLLPTVNGKMNFYVRCQDANGNNDMTYFVVEFGVSKVVVHSLPVIKATDLLNNSPITSGLTSVNVTVYVNKPVSGCKWSPTDRTYETMENPLDCSLGTTSILSGKYAGDYQCTATLNGITNSQASSANNFYFKCNDTIGDVNNAQSYLLHLKGTEPLVIQSTSPNNTVIEGTSNSILATLQVQTFAGAGGDGSSWCYYNNTVGNNKYTPFGNTGSYQSSQQLLLPGGNQTPIEYTFPVRCIDAANNVANATIKFGVLTDTIPPSVVRMYKDGSNLAIVTDKNATCVYDTNNCLYLFKDGSSMTDMGTVHEAPWATDRTYYIKCQDSLGVGPEPSNVCTAVVQASSL